jgi:hypothetical protein
VYKQNGAVFERHGKDVAEKNRRGRGLGRQLAAPNQLRLPGQIHPNFVPLWGMENRRFQNNLIGAGKNKKTGGRNSPPPVFTKSGH